MSGRPGLAWVGVFALLLQATLFAWHSHPVPFLHTGLPIAVSAANPGSPAAPAITDDDCSICLTLHHFSSVPVDFAALPALRPLAAADPPFDPVFVAGNTSAGFDARAPPRT